MSFSRSGSDGASREGRRKITPLSLLERLRENDRSAWQQVVTLYEPLLRFWCRRAGITGEDARDLRQEVFAAAAAGLAGFRRDRPEDSFRGWLRGIARRQISLHYRRNRGKAKAAGGSDAWRTLREIPDPLDNAKDEEETVVGQVYLRALERIRGHFEPATWQAFWLTAVEGHAAADLEGELGMTAVAIRQSKCRVLRLLKQTMGELLG